MNKVIGRNGQILSTQEQMVSVIYVQNLVFSPIHRVDIVCSLIFTAVQILQYMHETAWIW